MTPTSTVPDAVRELTPFAEAGVLGLADVHLAATVARLSPGLDPQVLLALAATSKAVRLGHVGIELATVGERLLDHEEQPDPMLPWPEVSGWADALTASPAVAAPAEGHREPLRPLVWDGERLYLQRYWHQEVTVADHLRRRAGPTSPVGPGLDEALDALFPVAAGQVDAQREAARIALTSRVAVIAGGPGTGKTRTIARVLAAATTAAGRTRKPMSVALAAPTGKAAARVTEAVRQAVAEARVEGVLDDDVAVALSTVEATTLHRLLGSRGDGTFRHNRLEPLVHDLVVVDEVSMVALPLMARLLDAIRPDARLVLVGDPDQLTSIEAGTVLADIVDPIARPHRAGELARSAATGPLAPHIAVLDRVHRFHAGSSIAALADAIRRGQADKALQLLRGSSPDVAWAPPDRPTALAALEAEVIDAAVHVVTAAEAGRAADAIDAATKVKVLTATRQGPGGLRHWTARIEDGAAKRLPTMARGRGLRIGRPVLVTANDPINGLSNGDAGVTVADADGRPVVALAAAARPRLLPPSRVREFDDWWAMTIHKSQGSEFDHVVVSLPAETSPILSRELLYTAVTRARRRVTIVGTEASVRAAVERPVARASGLGPRLWSGPSNGA